MASDALFHLGSYDYVLPRERIAQHPLPDRAASKLLAYRSGTVTHHTFRDLPDQLPQGSRLFFNDTKVIPARLHLQKDSGALVELFLLEPVGADVSQAMAAGSGQVWQAAIGNKKKWKADQQVHHPGQAGFQLRAEWIDRAADRVQLHWQPAATSLAQLLEDAGKVPLPPYMARQAEASDRERYQTVYAQHSGAVAAPTAGLHFTPEVLSQLDSQGVASHQLTLHVGAGTFRPVQVDDVRQHPMHAEEIVVRQRLLEALQDQQTNIAVGTTSMRTLESLYWMGVKAVRQEPDPWLLEQDYPYRPGAPVAATEALAALQARLSPQAERTAHTALMIRPGYSFQLVHGLITNFHMPKSTLLLLVHAFIGPDWKRLYQEALDHDYRFLSYGDSSLLLPNHKPTSS